MTTNISKPALFVYDDARFDIASDLAGHLRLTIHEDDAIKSLFAIHFMRASGHGDPIANMRRLNHTLSAFLIKWEAATGAAGQPDDGGAARQDPETTENEQEPDRYASSRNA